MELAELCGASVRIEGSQISGSDGSVECRGDACQDIDYQWDPDTNSYHFFNDGAKKVLLTVTSATVFGCSGSKTRRMRPKDEWDTGFFGFCKYEANYR